MNYLKKLNNAAEKKNSYVCVGLDIDLNKIPDKFKTEADPIFTFNKYIIDETEGFTAAYKPNAAFYEQYGLKGIEALAKTIEYIPDDIGVILDAKRGDIGNTAKAYAKSAFEDLGADAITLAPYMGKDSISPFLEYKDKFAYILCLTSNPGSQDFQKPELYKKVAKTIEKWDKEYNNCGLVVGATNSQEIKEIRELTPELPFLIPGIGAQGGDLENTVRSAVTKDQKGILINSSRGIIYADDPKNEAKTLQQAIISALNK